MGGGGGEAVDWRPLMRKEDQRNANPTDEKERVG